MLSGVKFIPRDQLHKHQEQEDDEDAASLQKRKKRNGSSSKSERDKHKTKRKTSSRYDSSDGITSSASDDDLVRIKKGSSRNKKWYSSDEHSSEDYSGSEGEDSYDQYSSKRKSRGKKNKKNGGKNHSSADLSSEDEGWKGGGKDRRNKGQKKVSDDFSDDGKKSHSMKDMEIARKEMGLDWMLRSSDKVDKKPAVTVNVQPEQTSDDEEERVNPKELNPYLKGNGSGYPDNVDEKRASEEQLPSSALVGDGGASWRLKALKRAREQAAREGRQLEDVVEERWGSLGQLAVTVASGKAASSRAHLHAINNRRRGLYMESQKLADNQNGIDTEQGTDRGYLKDVSVRHPDMRAPKVHDSLSWGKRKSQKMSTEDASLISAAASSLNKFANDGSFMNKVLGQQNDDFSGSVGFDANRERKMDLNMDSYDIGKPSDDSAVKEVFSANQLAAKALQLRMKGKHQEADKLMQEDENIKVRQGDKNSQYSIRHQRVGSMVRHVKDISSRRKEEDADRYLAQKNNSE
uniref:Nucleic acid binding protein n=1 Tax=Rhizophora mucronata TaxID=61149 RepID=A0A2P2KGG9_RHIMU